MDAAPSAGPARKARVSYFYDPEVGQFYYGQGHPMKPHRVRMAHSLVLHYGLHSKLDGYYTPARATAEDLAAFHSQDYVDFLKTITPDNTSRFTRELREFNMYEDCPVFDGLYQYCQIAAGGSLGAAVKLNYQTSDIAINWAGGLHHAKRAEASGFCYVNDIVLAILELLKYHQRVLYLDIDVHHGDGVEEAFLTTDRVMTVSFHKFGNGYFPGTGDLGNMGHGKGRGYALNVPLRDGITDEAYHSLFRPVMAKVMEVYRPEAIVLQCGTDSLAGDRLGVFNLSSKGHAACVDFMKSFGLPLMLLGGGGYKIINVARCWAAETGLAVGADLAEQLPPNEYYEYYGPVGYMLTVQPISGWDNWNTPEHLETLRNTILQRLAEMQGAPGVAFHERAPDGIDPDAIQDVNMADPDASPRRIWDGELDPEEDAAAAAAAGAGRRRTDTSFRDAPGSKPLSPSMLRPPSASRLTGGGSRDGGGGDPAAPAQSTQSTGGADEGGQAGDSGAAACSKCGTTKSSRWRRAPQTKALLCDACAQKGKNLGARLAERRQPNAASQGSGGGGGSGGEPSPAGGSGKPAPS